MENSSRTWEMEDIGNRHGFSVKACGRKPALPQIRPRFHGRGFDLWMRDRGGGGVGHGARIFNAINAPYPRLAFRGGQCRTRIMHALFGVSQTRQGGNQAGTPPLLLSRFQISGYDLSRWIDYLDRRYFHIPVVNFASALALTSPPRAKKNVGILVLLVDDGDKHFVQDRSFARFLIFESIF